MRRALAVSLIVVMALAGCSSNQDPASDAGVETPATTEAPSETPTSEEPSPSPAESQSPADAIEVEIEGDEVKPNGERIKVAVGEPILLEIKSDRPGELHVHSTPEQEPAFKQGESTIRFTIKTPGVVDVEEHESGIVILQLEVS